MSIYVSTAREASNKVLEVEGSEQLGGTVSQGTTPQETALQDNLIDYSEEEDNLEEQEAGTIDPNIADTVTEDPQELAP